MNAIIRTLLLLSVAGAMCAQAQETPQNSWKYSIGAMYEIENVEGQAEDKDGLYEPSVYFNAAYGPWSINLVMYQEGPVDYSSMTRGTYFNRPEFNLRYQLIGNDDLSLGLTGGVRNYGYHFENEDGSPAGTANTQRWKIQPDWNVKINQDLAFEGWLAWYRFVNDLNKTGYSDSRVETETGLNYHFNETLSVQAHYYLERGYNTVSGNRQGEFSTNEARIYFPIALGNNTFTPYTRLTIDRWSNWDWQDDGSDSEDHDYNRLGLLYAHDFDNGLSMTLEYAYEWQTHREGDTHDIFHYAGIGVNYAF
ncbi:OmpG family monomeric porin [Atlantibacter sp.]|uniref:OmpG family monomeric porin n=1 Tax=Atlantibacter sp. TaxID=1903473 RepID=UPI0028AAD6A0|nr:OmpG family monomeric porin [Atlantibacter sp.]